MCLLVTDILLFYRHEQTKTQQGSVAGRDDNGIGILLVKGRWPPKPGDCSRRMFASRVFTSGAREDVSRNTLSLYARTIKAGS
jgi:hypothetical protein